MSSLHGSVFEAAPIGLAVISADGDTILDANPYLCGLLGFEVGALAGIPVIELVGSRDLPLTSGVRRWRKADGHCIDVRVRLSGGKRAGNGAAFDLGTNVAVVETADPDEIARADENRDALVAAGLGEWRWEATDGRVTLSRRAAQIFGFPPGRSVTWGILRGQVENVDGERVREIVTKAVLQRRPYHFETPIRRGCDDASIMISARGEPVFGRDGSLAAVVGVVQDVTERVEVRRTLRDREQRLRVAASLAQLGIFEWHLLDDRATWENDRMYDIFGRNPRQGSIGKAEFLNEILHPDDRKEFRQAVSEALREDRNLLASGRVLRASDGSWRTIEMAGRFEREAPGKLPHRLIGVVADVTERYQAQERQTLLIRELHHRVKNTLATVQAIVGSTARSTSGIDAFFEAFVGRIKSLSYTHSVLTEDTWQTASLRQLLINELRPFALDEDDGEVLEDRISLDGPAVDLPSDIAVPIGMAIHELTTNAAKYGALSSRNGRISVNWSISEGGEAGILTLEWRESDGPVVTQPARQGFGSRLLHRVLSTQVQAEVDADYAPDGLRFVMSAPLPARNAALNPLV